MIGTGSSPVDAAEGSVDGSAVTDSADVPSVSEASSVAAASASSAASAAGCFRDRGALGDPGLRRDRGVQVGRQLHAQHLQRFESRLRLVPTGTCLGEVPVQSLELAPQRLGRQRLVRRELPLLPACQRIVSCCHRPLSPGGRAALSQVPPRRTVHGALTDQQTGVDEPGAGWARGNHLPARVPALPKADRNTPPPRPGADGRGRRQ